MLFEQGHAAFVSIPSLTSVSLLVTGTCTLFVTIPFHMYDVGLGYGMVDVMEPGAY
jgi:hypothetical protein